VDRYDKVGDKVADLLEIVSGSIRCGVQTNPDLRHVPY